MISKAIKMIVPNLGWLTFPIQTILFGENIFFWKHKKRIAAFILLELRTSAIRYN